MSVMIVNNETVNGMLQAVGNPYQAGNYYWAGEVYDWADTKRVGQLLINKNYHSYNERYSETGNPHRFQLRQLLPLKPVQILKLISHYEYQACEAEDWTGSEAATLCDILRRKAIGMLPGYDNAPWGL